MTAKKHPLAPATRMAEIEPFHVMEMMAQAAQLEQQGHPIIHMEVGEPDFDTAEPIVKAGVAALENGHTHYTQAHRTHRIKAGDFRLVSTTAPDHRANRTHTDNRRSFRCPANDLLGTA